MKISIIGLGSSSLMLCSILSKKFNKDELFIFEKKDRAGIKLAMTAKGRGNILNLHPTKDLITKYTISKGSEELLNSLYNGVKREYLINHFKSLGIDLVQEDGFRAFPSSYKAQDVVDALLSSIKANIYYNNPINSIKVLDDGTFLLNNSFNTDLIIIATGGASYPNTGSTGDIKTLLKPLNQKIRAFKAALSPIRVEEDISSLEGISLKNIKLYNDIEESNDDLMVTRCSFSGPAALSLRANSYKGDLIYIKSLDDIKSFEKELLSSKKQVSSLLSKYLPIRYSQYILQRAKIDLDQKSNTLTKTDRINLLNTLNKMSFTVSNESDILKAYATSGGLALSHLDKLSFSLKDFNKIYVIGEALDCTGHSGGYNLTFAFASAFKAANHIIKNYKDSI